MTSNQPTTLGTTLASDGVALAWARWTPPSPSTTVLLIHGWSGSRRYFDGVVPHLVARGADVVAVDLRFHGDSGPERPKRGPTGATPRGAHVARLAVDVHTVCVDLGLDGVTAIGTSMGAAVIWCYVELFGKAGKPHATPLAGRIARAVVVDQAPLQNRAPDWALGSNGCYDAQTLASLQQAVRGDPATFAAGNADACLATCVDAGTLSLLSSETARCDADGLAALMADHTQLDWRPLVASGGGPPTLVVVGGASKIFPPAGCRWVADAGGHRCVEFDGCGHWLYVEKAAEFCEVVWGWVVEEEGT